MTKLHLPLVGCLLLLAASLASAVEFSLGPAEILPDTEPALPIYSFTPDGQISLLEHGGEIQAYWPGSTSYRTLGKSLREMVDPIAVLEPGEKGAFDNGGAWLFSVFRRSEKNLLGFYHAEDHEFVTAPFSKFVAWKSIARCTSGDNGRTWKKEGQLITSARKKPTVPTWGGCGDCCVVRDEANERWLCYFQEHYLMIAASEDPEGKPGTWKKYFDGEFNQPGLGGRSTPLPGLSRFPGGNPSVVFSKALKLWLMVWHTWDDHTAHPRSVWLATSTDLIHWAAPKVVIKANANQQFWYPTLLSTDDTDGLKWQLIYAHFPNAREGERQGMIRTMEFAARKTP